jgi:hypothetical protein
VFGLNRPRFEAVLASLVYTTKVAGKTKTLQLRPGALLSKIEREVSEYKHFRATSERVIEVSEQLCNARPTVAAQEKKRLSSANIRIDITP